MPTYATLQEGKQEPIVDAVLRFVDTAQQFVDAAQGFVDAADLFVDIAQLFNEVVQLSYDSKKSIDGITDLFADAEQLFKNVVLLLNAATQRIVEPAGLFVGTSLSGPSVLAPNQAAEVKVRPQPL